MATKTEQTHAQGRASDLATGGLVGPASKLIKAIESGDYLASLSLYSEWLLTSDIGSLLVRQAADQLVWTLYHRNHRKDLNDAVRWAVSLGCSSAEEASRPNTTMSQPGGQS